MQWTVSRRIAAGFAVGLMLVVVVAVIGVNALRQATQSYEATLARERRSLIPALQADAASRGAAAQQFRFLLVQDEQFLKWRDSLLALSRALLTGLRDSAHTPEGRALW